MSRLRILTKSSSPRTAVIEIDKEIWGTLPKRVPLSYFGDFGDYEISEDEAAKLKETLLESGLNLLFDYLAKAEHCSSQCRNLLKRRQYHSTLIAEMLTRAENLNFLSDARYAELYIRDALEGGKSRRWITAKLKELRVASRIFEPLLEENYSPESSRGKVTEEIEKLLVRYREDAPAKAKEKVFSSLYRKGWELDEIRDAWEELRQRSR